MAATTAAEQARATLDATRAEEAGLAGERRRTEEAERAVAREAEAVAREAAWHEAQRTRLEGEVGPTRGRRRRPPVRPGTRRPPPLHRRPTTIGRRWPPGRRALQSSETAATDSRHDWPRTTPSAGMPSTAGLGPKPPRRWPRSASSGRNGRAPRSPSGKRPSPPNATASAPRSRRPRRPKSTARAALAALHAADAADRTRLTDAERAASGARERLRAADDRLRAADHAELEARLGLDALREGVLVELAGLGELGLRSLGVEPAPATAVDESADDDSDDGAVADDTAAFEAGLAVVATRWAAEAPSIPPPAPGRLAQLRRRFHELGAVNPYAVDEYAELKARLETLETQAADLRTAIEQTRELITELDTMIATAVPDDLRSARDARSRDGSSSCSVAGSPGCR